MATATATDAPAAAQRPAVPSAPAREETTAWDAVRAFGVVFGPSVALCWGLGACAGSAARALARRRRPHPLALAGAAALGADAVWGRRWMRTWGATAEELDAPLPGDELVERPTVQSTRAITIAAPVRDVWPWLAQIGQDRGGFYSYEWLENLAGCEMRNADRVHPEWQERVPGEGLLLHPAYAMPVERFEPGRAIVLRGWGAFVLQPLPGDRTRLLVRGRVPCDAAAFYVALVEIPHFVMERRMLLGIKQRAERR